MTNVELTCINVKREEYLALKTIYLSPCRRPQRHHRPFLKSSESSLVYHARQCNICNVTKKSFNCKAKSYRWFLRILTNAKNTQQLHAPSAVSYLVATAPTKHLRGEIKRTGQGSLRKPVIICYLFFFLDLYAKELSS